MPHIDESIRQIHAAGKATLNSTLDATRSIRRLAVADLALARSAFARSAIWISIGVMFGASSWLLCMAALITFLYGVVGWSWLMAFSVCALGSIVLTIFASWRAMRLFEFTSMQATRRQLSRYGLIADPDDDGDDTRKNDKEEA